jgi:copper chaperone CopZ
MSIKKALSGLEGVIAVVGNLENQNITVKWDTPASLERIKNTLKEINYAAV